VKAAECFERRLLRKENIGPGRWERSIEVSSLKLERAKSLFEDGYYEESIFQAYTSMFHAARAVLYHDGVSEKSHVCVISYLEEYHSSQIGIDMIGWLDEYRIERHEAIYGMDQIFRIENEARLAVDRCMEFHGRIQRLIHAEEEDPA